MFVRGFIKPPDPLVKRLSWYCVEHAALVPVPPLKKKSILTKDTKAHPIKTVHLKLKETKGATAFMFNLDLYLNVSSYWTGKKRNRHTGASISQRHLEIFSGISRSRPFQISATSIHATGDLCIEHTNSLSSSREHMGEGSDPRG